MSRLVVCLLAVPGLAAAAPIPEVVADRDWSAPADGVRARLTTAQARYRVGESVRLTLELQEVGGRDRRLDPPRLMPVISYPGSHPYREHDFPWVVSCDRDGGNPKVFWNRRQTARTLDHNVRLARGGTYRVEITALPAGTEPPPDRPMKEGEPRRETVEFMAAREPGTYRLRATFTRPAEPDRRPGPADWTARRLRTPDVRVEVVE
jgi:hypothetical protein